MNEWIARRQELLEIRVGERQMPFTDHLADTVDDLDGRSKQSERRALLHHGVLRAEAGRHGDIVAIEPGQNGSAGE